MKFLDKWKSEWLKKHEASLIDEFQESINELEVSLESQMDEWVAKEKSLKDSMNKAVKDYELKFHEIDLLQQKLEMKRQKLTNIDAQLNEQIELIEAKSSPSSVWVNSFGNGYTLGFETAMKMLPEISISVRDAIKQQAIDDTLKRLRRNGT